MYHISQFKPTLYLLLLLGICGYGVAAESPGVAVFGATGILLNGWLVYTGRFIPMPRIVANLVTIVAVLYVAREMVVPNTTTVMIIGKFLVLLQLIKLWEQRANRDYAQLLVLSLLLMVAASINTASMLFGLMMVVYLFLSLYCCLLFHLKLESDRARDAFALPEGKMNPATLRQDERYLTRSMRRLTAFVSTLSILMAVVVFIVFPRGAGAGMFGPLQLRPSQALTGFSENVSFQQLAKITQNDEEVAWVSVKKNGVPVRGTEALLLRGVTLDFYHERPIAGGPWQWQRSASPRDNPTPAEHNKTTLLREPGPRVGDEYVQRITLNPTGTRTIFGIVGAISITPRKDLKLRISPSESVIQTEDPLTQTIDYEIVSSNSLPPEQEPTPEQLRQAYRRAKSINPKVLEYALRPDVSGVDATGQPLATQRPRDERVTAIDEQIAQNIDDHLKSSFTYTLDLTDAAKLKRNEDPMVAFLYDLRRGHCEYFAGAMTLMCQSLGLQARVVNGFKCDEFNELGGYYIVRQSHAHSWVEVLTAEGWKTFDPTSSREAGRADGGWWERVKHFVDFMEFTYGNAVIAYDNDHRDNLITSFDAQLTNTTLSSADWLVKFRNWFELNVYQLSSTAIGGIMALMVSFMLFMVLWFAWERWTLRRRAARIGLESLPTPDKMRLARQLGFYDDLMQLLARRQIVRAKHQTPLEFSQSLLFLPNRAFETVHRLTRIFYRVRYGQAELSQGSRRRLGIVIAQLDETLNPTRKT